MIKRKKLDVASYVGTIILCIWLFVIVSWIVNAYKFSECDFKMKDESDLKCELIHGIGIFGFAPLTVWFDTDA